MGRRLPGHHTAGGSSGSPGCWRRSVDNIARAACEPASRASFRILRALCRCSKEGQNKRWAP
eukprot:961114-Pyramimonas_sp.AAC.1